MFGHGLAKAPRAGRCCCAAAAAAATIEEAVVRARQVACGLCAARQLFVAFSAMPVVFLHPLRSPLARSQAVRSVQVGEQRL